MKLTIEVTDAKGKKRKVFEKVGEDSEIWKTAYELVFGKDKEQENDEVEKG